MTVSPPFYVNSPVSGTSYYAPAGYWFQPNNGTSWTATCEAWTGANGTGSLVVVSTLTAINRDITNSLDRNSFTGSSANTANASSSAGVNGSNVFAGGGKYTGSAPGSLKIYGTYTGLALIPQITDFNPKVGGPGTSVVITGNFFNGATAVTFNGTSASYSVDNDGQITATVPVGATTGLINVANPSGSGNSASNFVPSTVFVDDGGAFQASLVYVDDGAAWQLATVWVDDGATWVQIA